MTLWLVAVAALWLAISSRRRLRDLADREGERQRTLRDLTARLAALETRLGAGPAPAQATTARANAAPPQTPAPAAAPTMDAAPPIAPPPSIVPPPPIVPSPTARPDAPAMPRPAAAPPPPRAPRPSLPSIDWETLVGVKLFSWIAGVALVLAAVFFLRYSIEHGWLSNPVKMAIGLLVGTGLVVGCELPAARRYAVTASALAAAGVATLFATFFAAHALWALVPQLPTFALMALVTAVAVLLSIRRDAPFVAILGLLGGFATPALLSTGEDRPIGLFGYLLLLNVGLAWVAYRKGWAVLTTLSVALTAVYQWGWVVRYLDASRLPLSMGIFLVFPLMQVAALALAERRPSSERGEQPLFARTAIAAAALPVLFVLHLAAVPAYGAHANLLFGFMLLLAAGLTAVAAARGPTLLHPVGGLATVLAFALWLAVSYHSASWPAVLAWVAAFVALYLAAPAVAAAAGYPLGDDGRRGRLVAAALLAVFPVLATIEPAAAAPGLLFGVLGAIVLVVATVAVREAQGTLHYTAAVAAIAAQAAWSIRHLDAERLLPALAIYGGFGALYAGVPVAAARYGKRLEPERGGFEVLLASLALLLILAAGAAAPRALPGLALLLLGLNVAMFVQPGVRRYRWLALAAGALSWLVLAVWWGTAMTDARLAPALVAITALGGVLLAGHAWLAAEAPPPGEPRSPGIWLALVSHGFLLVVAASASLAVPPWPVFAVLGVLDLAVLAAALRLRDGRPFAGALALSQLVVLRWVGTAPAEPWTLAALGAATAIVLGGLGGLAAARRRGGALASFGHAAVAAALGGQLVAIRVADAAPPGLAWIVLVHVGFLAALLVVAEEIRLRLLAVVGAVPAVVATGLWAADALARPGGWPGALVFAAAPFLVLWAYPLVVRAERDDEPWPYVAPVLAGVATLFLARHCLRLGGWESVVGIVPVIQAALLLVLLRPLVATRRVPLHQDGRVALAAAGTLGFATVAIPLQLSREWITVGWALEAAAVAWLYARVRFPQLLLWTLGLGAAVFVRLALNPAVLEYHPRAATPIWNWYLYAYGVSAAALFVAAWLLRPTGDRVAVAGTPRASTVLSVAATVLLFLLLNVEIADVYSEGGTLTFNFSAGLAQDLTYTIGWALFAIGLLVAGIRLAARPVRSAALGLLVVTVVKCFLHDLWRLGGLYRVGSFVGLAICLSLVAILLQRFVLVPREETS